MIKNTENVLYQMLFESNFKYLMSFCGNTSNHILQSLQRYKNLCIKSLYSLQGKQRQKTSYRVV